jgi:hypothetical protein
MNDNQIFEAMIADVVLHERWAARQAARDATYLVWDETLGSFVDVPVGL